MKYQHLNEQGGYSNQVNNDVDSTFTVPKEKLSDMFELRNIGEHVSEKQLQELGGINKLLELLKTDHYKGIACNSNQEEFDLRVKKYGKNAPFQRTMKTYWELVKEVFEDFILRVLTVAAVVSILIGILRDGIDDGWIDGVTIALAVVIIILVTATNNYLKERQYQNLYAKLDESFVVVHRDGKEEAQLNSWELVVGDIVDIRQGDQILIDGILITDQELHIDESMMTGETKLVTKSKNGSPFLISGTKVMEGKGKMVTCAVGLDSNLGKYYRDLPNDHEQTPLQEKLEIVANDIGKIGLFAAIATFTVLVIHLIIGCFEKDEWFSVNNFKLLVDYIIIAIAIIVMAVPEGLPLAVTIALAYSMKRMQSENYLIKHLSSCEIMGGTDVICTDKTGTLTMNKMEVIQVFFGKTISKVAFIDSIPKKAMELIMESICYNSSSSLKEVNGKFEHIGNKTECALLELALRKNYNYQEYRKEIEENDNKFASNGKIQTIKPILKTFEFSSSKKMMTTVIKLDESTVRVFVKGSIDTLLPACVRYHGPQDEKAQNLDERTKEDIRENVKREEQKMMRIILLGYKDIKNSGNIATLDENDLICDLTMLCAFAMKDPLRMEIPSAIEKCRKAHIRVVMITGDAFDTAIAIAKEATILPHEYHPTKGDGIVMEGREFEELCGDLVPIEEQKSENFDDAGDPEAGEEADDSGSEKSVRMGISNLDRFKEVASRLCVVARATPRDKLLLVTGMKQLNHIVAVTGDGTNDALALRKADVGIAMGINGTQVAKDAAGIILLDDNFNSIVTSVKWGRNIYNSIRMFIQFQLTVNIVALFLSFIGATVLKEAPLSSVQMLWVNLIMDTLASLALATEPARDELLNGPPYRRDDPLITKDMKIFIGTQAAYQITILALMLFHFHRVLDLESSRGVGSKWDEEQATHYTLFFNTFVFMQIWNEFNARKLRMRDYNIFKDICANPLFHVVILVAFGVQILMVQFGRQAVRCNDLSLAQHLVCISIGFSTILVNFLVKVIYTTLWSRFFREPRSRSGRSENVELARVQILPANINGNQVHIPDNARA